MRILFQDPKSGEIRLLVETQDDIWHLYNIISKGDLVTTLTHRRVETKLSSDKLRPERAEKRKMLLGIRAQESEFHDFSDRLRVSGLIEEGPQDLGQHHTLNIEPGDTVTVKKERWPDAHIQRIKDAITSSKKPIITFLSIDDSEAQIAVLRQAGLQHLSSIQAHIPGKDYESRQEDAKRQFFGEVLSELTRVRAQSMLVILGPGFARDEFVDFAREKNPGAIEGCQSRSTGQSGMAGISELIKSGLDMKLLEGQRAAFEIQLVEQLLSEIAKDGKYAYGPEEVRQAVESGAVHQLLVLDRLVREGSSEELMKAAEKARASVVIISSAHEGGRKLESLGGIAALLRYKPSR